MILTRKQIVQMYQVTGGALNGNDKYYIEEGEDGKIRFGAIEIVEKRRAMSLTIEKAK